MQIFEQKNNEIITLFAGKIRKERICMYISALLFSRLILRGRKIQTLPTHQIGLYRNNPRR
jgi:hypothetical protein